MEANCVTAIAESTTTYSQQNYVTLQTS